MAGSFRSFAHAPGAQILKPVASCYYLYATSAP